MKSSLSILHLNTEKTWRGGENQIKNLVSSPINEQYNLQHHLAVRADGELQQRLQDKCSLFSMNSSTPLMPYNLLKMVQFIKEHNISIIDAHSSKTHAMALGVKAMLPQLKLVVHRRVDYKPKNNPMSRYKYCSPHIDAYVAISDKIATILDQYGIDKAKIRTVRSAVDEEPYKFLEAEKEKRDLCKQLNLDPSLCLLGNASAFTHQKGHHTLIHSLRILEQKKLPFHCILAGNGFLLPEIKTLVGHLGLQHRVSFLGFIADVPKLLSGLDILAMPSNFEGLGTLILEGIYAQCAIVASRVGGIPEMISHGKRGFLSEKGNSREFAKFLEMMILDAGLRKDTNVKARAYVRKNFSLEQMVQGNIAVYRSIMDS